MATIVGPIAPYNNVPIAPQNFQPSQFPITAISLGFSTTVTMGNSTNSVPPNYIVGQLCRLLIPSSFGSIQLNQVSGYVLSIPSSTSVVLGINSSQNVDPFVLSNATTVAQIVAVGDVNQGVTNATGLSNQGTFVPGCFQNISS